MTNLPGDTVSINIVLVIKNEHYLRAQESPGEPRTAPGQPRKGQNNPRRAQDSPRRAQESPKEPQESPGEASRAQERPREPRTGPGAYIYAIFTNLAQFIYKEIAV